MEKKSDNTTAVNISDTSGIDTQPADSSSSGAWLVLIILTLVYTANIADRFVFSTLLESIKTEFALSDASAGFLTGVSLAIFYVAAGLPLGALADRTNRKKMIAISLAAWSIMTMLCGISKNYWQLLLARIGVGIGEAGGTPPSHSLISDVFPARSRALALSIWGVGASLGAWLGASGAGYLNDMYGWRTTLLIFGVAGLPLSIATWLCLREPKRGRFDVASNDDTAATASLLDSLKFIIKNKALFHVMAGATIITFWGWGILWWTPSFLVRSFDLTVGQAGQILGPIHGIGGTALMFATVAVMLWFKTKPMHWQPQFVALTTLLGTLPAVLAFGADSLDTTSLLLWLFVPVIYIYIGPTTALVQNLFPPNMRAKGAAILLLVANLANLAVAPQLIGFLSDIVATRIEDPSQSMRYVLFGCAFTGIWAAWHYWAAGHHMRKQGYPSFAPASA